jgi:hypothetical protein
MVKVLTALAAAGLAGAALALAAPVTAHAGCAPNGCGPCFFSSPNHPVQSEDFGTGNKHSFTDSHQNCVAFFGKNNTAFLNESNGNSMVFTGSFNKVDDFNKSNDNQVDFEDSAFGNHLQASNAFNNEIVFNAAVNDFVDLLGTTNDAIIVTGSGLFADVVDPPTGGGHICFVNSSTAAGGTKSHPATVVC